MSRVATAPGRVNLIGDHTDYTGGLAMPMAIDLATTVRFTERPGSHEVRLTSDVEAGEARLPLPAPGATGPEVPLDAPRWGRTVAGIAFAVRPPCGGTGTVSSTVPIAAGLSSSAALELSLALAFGFRGDPVRLAEVCQAGGQAATGVPCGVMDQLASACGVEGAALFMDCTTLSCEPVALPGGLDVLVVHSGEPRHLADSGYALRRSQCEAAEAEIGPLRDATAADAGRIADPLLRRRARHVVTENARVRAFAAALAAGDLGGAGALIAQSHASLAADFEVSTPVLDELVGRLSTMPGVHGARLTGAGFGGCVVALCEAGSVSPDAFGTPAWIVRPSAGARVVEA